MLCAQRVRPERFARLSVFADEAIADAARLTEYATTLCESLLDLYRTEVIDRS